MALRYADEGVRATTAKHRPENQGPSTARSVRAAPSRLLGMTISPEGLFHPRVTLLRLRAARYSIGSRYAGEYFRYRQQSGPARGFQRHSECAEGDPHALR